MTDEELRLGREAYNVVRIDYEEGRHIILKGNIFKHLYRFWHAHLRPLDPDVDIVLLWMLHTGHYIPASQWCLTPCGRGLNWRQANAMWRIVRHPDKVRLGAVHDLFFHSDRGQLMRFPEQDNPYDMTFEAAQDLARQCRESGRFTPLQADLEDVSDDGVPDAAAQARADAASVSGTLGLSDPEAEEGGSADMSVGGASAGSGQAE